MLFFLPSFTSFYFVTLFYPLYLFRLFHLYYYCCCFLLTDSQVFRVLFIYSLWFFFFFVVVEINNKFYLFICLIKKHYLLYCLLYFVLFVWTIHRNYFINEKNTNKTESHKAEAKQEVWRKSYASTRCHPWHQSVATEIFRLTKGTQTFSSSALGRVRYSMREIERESNSQRFLVNWSLFYFNFTAEHTLRERE